MGNCFKTVKSCGNSQCATCGYDSMCTKCGENCKRFDRYTELLNIHRKSPRPALITSSEYLRIPIQLRNFQPDTDLQVLSQVTPESLDPETIFNNWDSFEDTVFLNRSFEDGDLLRPGPPMPVDLCKKCAATWFKLKPLNIRSMQIIRHIQNTFRRKKQKEIVYDSLVCMPRDLTNLINKHSSL